MEPNLQSYLMVALVILTLIPVVIGVIKRTNKEEEERLKEIREAKNTQLEEEEEEELEREADALQEFMSSDDDDVIETYADTFVVFKLKEDAITLEEVKATYPKLAEKYLALYGDVEVGYVSGNGFLMYLLVKTHRIWNLRNLNFDGSYNTSSETIDGYEFFTIASNVVSADKPKKRSRRRLSQKVKDDVWNRDGGKCVECDSNENLEFDHIIPHSKGGADTYRNIQLLCQDCNRTKSAKIG